MPFKRSVLAAAVAGLHFTLAVDLDVNNAASVKAAARDFAYGVQSFYQSNQTGAATSIGTFPPPSYWWEGGAIWGGMVDYWAYTDDSSWNEVTAQGLLAQANAPAYDYMPPAYYSSLGNDDQAFWALSAMSAEEYGFPVPQGQQPGFWLKLVKNVFDTQTPRWDTSTCGGGLRWQIFESNKGYTYKNSVSSGSLFQIAARLARYTGNQTYVEWANKIWDWQSDVGFTSPTYDVYDGAESTTNCAPINRIQWSYNPALLIYGTAILGDYTHQQIWNTRTEGLMTAIKNVFFSPYSNATNIMFEPACEPLGTCNYDQLSFKAYLSRWLAKAAVVYPAIKADVDKYLSASALAAAGACTGGNDRKTCGQKWYVGGFDGVNGVGQELSAMETVQALLLLSGNAAHAMLGQGSQQNANSQAAPPTSAAAPPPSPTSTPSSSPHSSTSSASRTTPRSVDQISSSSLITTTRSVDQISFSSSITTTRSVDQISSSSLITTTRSFDQMSSSSLITTISSRDPTPVLLTTPTLTTTSSSDPTPVPVTTPTPSPTIAGSSDPTSSSSTTAIASSGDPTSSPPVTPTASSGDRASSSLVSTTTSSADRISSSFMTSAWSLAATAVVAGIAFGDGWGLL